MRLSCVVCRASGVDWRVECVSGAGGDGGGRPKLEDTHPIWRSVPPRRPPTSASRLPSPSPPPCQPPPYQSEVLGDIKNFQRFTPAHVLAGAHSINGSDYSQVTLSSWVRPGHPVETVRRNATVSFQSTAGVLLSSLPSSSSSASAAAAASSWPSSSSSLSSSVLPCNGTAGLGGAQCDLVLLASCTGADCASLALMVSADFAWSRAGTVELMVQESESDAAPSATTTTLLASPAGFAPVAVRALSPTTTITTTTTTTMSTTTTPSLNNDAPSIVLPFSSGSGSGTRTVGVSTGSSSSVSSARRSSPSSSAAWTLQLAEAATAAAAERAAEVPAAVAAAGAAAAELYRPMRDVLMWNTVYTHALQVYTPVSRTWVQVGWLARKVVWACLSKKRSGCV